MKNLLVTAVHLFCIFHSALPCKHPPALWQVEKNGVTSYLFGTVHVGDEAMKGLPSYVEQAISRSDKVVVEVDISALSPMQIQQRSMPLMLRNGRTLETELSSKIINASVTILHKRVLILPCSRA